jgi:signal transduction histidine kinase
MTFPRHYIFTQILCLALLGSPLSLLGQNQKKIDSLQKVLTKTNAGAAKFNLLTDLAWEYRFAYPDSTIHYTKKAYALGKVLNLPIGLARALNFQGVAYNYKGDRLRAYEVFMEAQRAGMLQHDTLQIAHSNNNIGRLFFDQGMLSKAYDYYLNASSLFKSKKDSYGLAYTLQSIGALQMAQKDFSKAEQNYKEALAIRLKRKDQRDIMSAYVLLSRLYYEKKNHSKAITVLLKADSAGELIHDRINLAEIRTLLAKNYLEQGHMAEAEEAAESGAEVIKRFKSIRIMPENYLILGKIKMKQNNFLLAESYLKTALNISMQIKDLQYQMQAYEQLWKLALLKNQKSKAIEYMNEYLLRKDSIKDLDLTRQVERLQFQVQIEQKEKENELLKVREAQQASLITSQRTQNILLFFVLGLSISLAIIFWLNSKRIKRISEHLEAKNHFIEVQRHQIEKRNSELLTKNQKLEDLNHEKDMLMNIVAHDLKSPLNRIIGLINITQMEGQLSSSQQEYFRMMKEVAQSNLDLITDLLDVNAFDVAKEISSTTSVNLKKLLKDRIANFQFAASSKEITIILDSAEITLESNPEYISRIADNLISNAIKFSKRRTTIQVTALPENQSMILKVKDQGPGFSKLDREMIFQRFKKLSARPTAGESSNGLGLAIVKTLVDRLHGAIELNTEEEKGSEFIIRIPVKVVESIGSVS